MKKTNLILVLLCLALLVALCACVDARAEEQERKDTQPAQEIVEVAPEESTQKETYDFQKTPIDAITGRETEAPAEKGTELTESWSINIGEDYDPDLIPDPRPVEPPVEEQSVESSAAEE